MITDLRAIASPIDHSRGRGVASRMARLCGIIACALLLALSACGGKDKKKNTTPDSTSKKDGDTKLMGDGDEPNERPDGLPDDSGSSDGDDGKDEDSKADKDGKDGKGGDKGDPTAEAGKDGEPDEPPKIEPPDLDLSAADVKKRVGKHLRAGWNALKGKDKDPDLAIREARKALAVDGTNIDAAVIIAHAYYTKRLYDTAEVVLDMLFKERKKAKSNPGVYYVYGLIYDATDRPEQAKLAYQSAVNLAPRYRSALINLGTHLLRNKNYGEAISLYEKLTQDLDVKTAVTWTNLGSAYRGRSGDYPADSPRRAQLLRQAETAYKRALSVERNFANVYYNLGLLYLDADPFPAPDGRPMDKLKRLERAKTYFDEYRNMTGADIELVNRRTKEVSKLIKRETKRRKRAAKKRDS